MDSIRAAGNRVMNWMPGIHHAPKSKKITLAELGAQISTYVKSNWDILLFRTTSIISGMHAYPGFGPGLITGLVLTFVTTLSLPKEERQSLHLNHMQILALTIAQIAITVLMITLALQGISCPPLELGSAWILGLIAGIGGPMTPSR